MANDSFGKVYNVLSDTAANVYLKGIFLKRMWCFNRKCNFSHKLTSEMKKEYRAYWKSFGFRSICTDWLEYVYGFSGKFDRRIVPNDLFNIYLDSPYPNNRDMVQNKAYQPMILQDVKYPENIVRNVNGYFLDKKGKFMSADEALGLVSEHEHVFIKPSIRSGAGINVRKFRGAEVSKGTFESYGKDFVVQKAIRQSRSMARFNETCVNTVKLFSFLYKGKVHILSSELFVGSNESVRSNSAGEYGYIVGIHNSGQLHEKGFNTSGRTWSHTCGGELIKSMKIDFYQECVDIVREAHRKLLHFPFIGWDFAQNEKNETILIEYNLKWNVVHVRQLCNGPLFGDMTDEVLKDARGNIKNNASILF